MPRVKAALTAKRQVVGDAAAGWLSVDPKTTPDLFRGPFVAGGGWGIYTQRLEDAFRGALGTKVALTRGRRGGKLVISFFSDEELQAIYEHIVGQDL